MNVCSVSLPCLLTSFGKQKETKIIRSYQGKQMLLDMCYPDLPYIHPQLARGFSADFNAAIRLLSDGLIRLIRGAGGVNSLPFALRLELSMVYLFAAV